MNGSGIKRVLVALESEREARSALQSAAEIATRLHAELLGLFVEDENLLALAELPIAREIAYGSTTSLTRTGLERSLQRRAGNLQREMDAALKHWQLQGGFHTLRGEIATQLLAMTQEEDLLILGKALKTRLTQQLGQTTQLVWQHAECSLALMPSGKRLERPVVVLVEDSPIGMKALDLAKRLAQADSYNMTVLIPALPAIQQQALENKVLQQLTADNIPPHLLRLAHNQASEVLDAIQQQRGRLLILPAQAQTLDASQQQTLISSLQVPVLVAR